MTAFEKIVSYRLYRLENTSTQVFGSQETCIDKQLKQFREFAADFAFCDGARPITLSEFLKDIRTGSEEFSVS